MAREKSTLREECFLIKQQFPDKGILGINDIMKYTGKSRSWCFRHGFKPNMCVSELAKALINL